MYSFTSRIRYSETDSSGRLSLPGLVDYFQDCSTFQSEDLGLGVEALRRQGLVWVLCSWQIEILRYPALGERVEIGTFPYDFKGFLGSRNFFMKGAGGEWLAKGNSLWSLLSTDSMKPVGASAGMLEAYELEPRLEMEYLPRRIAMPEGMRETASIQISSWHLDTNHHVNNGQYIHLAGGLLTHQEPVGMLRAEYKQQAWLGDVLVPYVWEDEREGLVSFRCRDGSVYVNVQQRFRGAGETDGSKVI